MMKIPPDKIDYEAKSSLSEQKRKMPLGLVKMPEKTN